MKKKSLEITKKEKVRFLIGRRKTAKLAFDGFVIYKKKLVKAIRKKYGYSPNTIDGDILSSFERAWRSM